MVPPKITALAEMVFGVFLIAYGLIESLDGVLTIPTRHETYDIAFSNKPGGFVLMLAIFLIGGLVLSIVGWKGWRK